MIFEGVYSYSFTEGVPKLFGLLLFMEVSSRSWIEVAWSAEVKPVAGREVSFSFSYPFCQGFHIELSQVG